MQTQTTPAATMTVKRDFVTLPPTIGDRITFNTPDDGLLGGFVSAFRSHLGNGEVFAWVELEGSWTGTFRGVPLRNIETADGFGRNGHLHQAMTTDEFRRQYLCNFSNVAQILPTEMTHE